MFQITADFYDNEVNTQCGVQCLVCEIAIRRVSLHIAGSFQDSIAGRQRGGFWIDSDVIAHRGTYVGGRGAAEPGGSVGRRGRRDDGVSWRAMGGGLHGEERGGGSDIRFETHVSREKKQPGLRQNSKLTWQFFCRNGDDEKGKIKSGGNNNSINFWLDF